MVRPRCVSSVTGVSGLINQISTTDVQVRLLPSGFPAGHASPLTVSGVSADRLPQPIMKIKQTVRERGSSPHRDLGRDVVYLSRTR